MKKVNILTLCCVGLYLQAGARFVEAAPPVVPTNSVVNNASFAAGTNALAPGTIAAIFGSNLNDGSQIQFSSFGSNGKLLTTLGGTSVTFNGIAAPMFSSFPGQLNVQVPFELAGATSATVVVTVAGQSSAPQTVPIGPSSPGIFSLNNQGTGQGAILLANSSTIVASTCSLGLVPARSADAGGFVTIFATGLGAVNNAPATGAPASGSSSTTTTLPQVTIGGIPALVTFSGLAPGFAGLYQINAQVPASAPAGDLPLVLSIGGTTSNTVTLNLSNNGRPGLIFVGNAQSLICTFPGSSFGTDSATGFVNFTATGTSSGNQTVYTGSGTGSGTDKCPDGSTTNWTGSLTAATITVSPAVTSLTTNGGTVNGTYGATISRTACGATGGQTLSGSVTGTVAAGGAVRLSLAVGGS